MEIRLRKSKEEERGRYRTICLRLSGRYMFLREVGVVTSYILREACKRALERYERGELPSKQEEKGHYRFSVHFWVGLDVAKKVSGREAIIKSRKDRTRFVLLVEEEIDKLIDGVLELLKRARGEEPWMLYFKN